MELVMKLRGNNPATVQDIIDLRRLIQEEHTKKNVHLSRMEERLRYAREDRFKIDQKLNKLDKLVHTVEDPYNMLHSPTRTSTLCSTVDLERLRAELNDYDGEEKHTS